MYWDFWIFMGEWVANGGLIDHMIFLSFAIIIFLVGGISGMKLIENKG